MPKKDNWNKGAGAYSDSDSGLTPGRNEDTGPNRDISGVVEKNANVDDGYSGGLVPQKGRR